jgi:hypothetical protein
MRVQFTVVLVAAVLAGMLSCRDTGKVAQAPSSDANLAPVETPPETIAPLNAQLAASLLSALDGLVGESPEKVKRLSAVFLGELETNRLPRPFRVSLKELASVPPQNRAHHMARLLGSRQVRPIWTSRLCDGDLGLLDRLGAMPSAERMGFLMPRCRFLEMGLVSEEEATAGEALDLLLAHTAWVFLEPGGPIAPVERRLLRAIAIGDPTLRSGASP